MIECFRRFEYVSGTSNKFWEVWVEDQTVVHCRWGRIDGPIGGGQRGSWAHPYPYKRHRDLVRGKLAKGYRECSTPQPIAKPAVVAAPVPGLRPRNRRRELLAAARKALAGGHHG